MHYRVLVSLSPFFYVFLKANVLSFSRVSCRCYTSVHTSGDHNQNKTPQRHLHQVAALNRRTWAALPLHPPYHRPKMSGCQARILIISDSHLSLIHPWTPYLFMLLWGCHFSRWSELLYRMHRPLVLINQVTRVHPELTLLDCTTTPLISRVQTGMFMG